MDIQVILTPQLEEIVRRKIASGRFASASEVIGAALRLMAEHEHAQAGALAQLRQEIQEGLDSGPAVPWDAGDIQALGRALRSVETDGDA